MPNKSRCRYETASETIFINFVDPTGRKFQPGDPIGKNPWHVDILQPNPSTQYDPYAAIGGYGTGGMYADEVSQAAFWTMGLPGTAATYFASGSWAWSGLSATTRFFVGTSFTGGSIIANPEDPLNYYGTGILDDGFKAASSFNKLEFSGAPLVQGELKSSALLKGDLSTPIYRLAGGEAPAMGRSWTTIDPRSFDSIEDYMKAAGIGDWNEGTELLTGTLKSFDGAVGRTALPIEGNPNPWLPEIRLNGPAEDLVDVQEIIQLKNAATNP